MIRLDKRYTVEECQAICDEVKTGLQYEFVATPPFFINVLNCCDGRAGAWVVF